FCGGRRSDSDAGWAPSEIAVPMVYRSFAAHPGKISAHKHSRIQSAGVSAFRGDLRDAAAGSDLGIQEGRTRINPGRRRRNSRGPSTKENFPVKNKQRPMARGDAGGARARIKIERH